MHLCLLIPVPLSPDPNLCYACLYLYLPAFLCISKGPAELPAAETQTLGLIPLAHFRLACLSVSISADPAGGVMPVRWPPAHPGAAAAAQDAARGGPDEALCAAAPREPERPAVRAAAARGPDGGAAGGGQGERGGRPAATVRAGGWCGPAAGTRSTCWLHGRDLSWSVALTRISGSPVHLMVRHVREDL
jgi:hypothetical protein